MNSENKLAGLGLLTAISASLCCITPFLALLAGTSGLASTLSWLEPLRPYFIGLTLLVLGIAWYKKLKPQKQIDCNCDTTEKTPFIQTKVFLGMVTVFAVLMLAFPMYTQIFFPEKNGKTAMTNQTAIKTTEFKINGMTCAGCEEHVNHELNKLTGIIHTEVSYKAGSAIVKFDYSQTNNREIEKAIAKTGYAVINKEEIE